jgi:thioredoxin reductase (NADPH)
MIAGAITRAQVMKNLQTLIENPARNKEILTKISPENHTYEVAIIGGGPAGLTAGIYLAQAKIKTCIIDQSLPGGNIKNTHLVSNYPGFPEAQNGYMLAHHMTEQTQKAGVDFFSASTINAIDLDHKTLLLDDYITINSKIIIIATGTSPKKLNIPGEAELIGKGISFCATCDAKYFQEKDVIIIGGGNSAIEEADFIAKFAKNVTIIHQFEDLTANKEAQEKCLKNPKIKILFSHKPRSFAKQNNKIQVKIENLKTNQQETLEGDGIFIFIGMQGNTELFRQQNPSTQRLKFDQQGYIKTIEDMETNLSNIYAIGDVTSKKYRQITTAINDGTIAAMHISRKH